MKNVGVLEASVRLVKVPVKAKRKLKRFTTEKK